MKSKLDNMLLELKDTSEMMVDLALPKIGRASCRERV